MHATRCDATKPKKTQQVQTTTNRWWTHRGSFFISFYQSRRLILWLTSTRRNPTELNQTDELSWVELNSAASSRVAGTEFYILLALRFIALFWWCVQNMVFQISNSGANEILSIVIFRNDSLVTSYITWWLSDSSDGAKPLTNYVVKYVMCVQMFCAQQVKW